MITRNKNPQYNLRISEDLKSTLQIEATRNGVSLNQEIINRLTATVEQDEVVREHILDCEDPDAFGYSELLNLYEKQLKSKSPPNIQELWEEQQSLAKQMKVLTAKINFLKSGI